MLSTWPAHVEGAANTFAPGAQAQTYQPPGEGRLSNHKATADPTSLSEVR